MKTNTKIYRLLLACFALWLFVGCNSYLDVVPKGQQLLETAEDFSMLMNDESMLSYPTGDIAYISDDEWVNPLVAYNYFQNFSIAGMNIMYVDPTTADRLPSATGALYTQCYNRIQKISNIILSSIDQASGDGALKEKTKAEAKALRAYNYFMLINVYARHYTPETLNDLAIPLPLEFNLESDPPQATVKQVYEAIEKDLADAIPVLERSSPRANAYHFNAAAAYALKAKVLLYKKDFAGAKTAALASYALFSQQTDFIFDLVRYHNEGASYKVGSDIPQNLYFGYTNSTPPMAPNTYKTLMDTINDVRYADFYSFLTNMAGTNNTNPNQRGDRDYAPAFDAANRNGAKNFSYNFTGLRTTDVVLMLAELEARADNYTKAMEYVNMVRSKRIVGYTPGPIPATRQEAMTEVITERRREFLLGFNRFMDLRRLNTEPEYRVTLTRTLAASPDFTRFLDVAALGGAQYVTGTLPWDSWLWVAPLPYAEFNKYKELKYNVPY